ncbi:MAG: DUF4406 domain-containing protein [Verrucomicrobiales bacterium]|jgi:hypothetical protein|nr:DUF4406 domain-containing protein [Verrucomicrobiales bacterium]
MRKVFICGPMTGLPEFNYPAFFAAEETLRELGFRVFNPARSLDGTADAGRTDLPWEFYLSKSIPMLCAADMVLVLDGWEDSKGARLELEIARQLRKPLQTVGNLRASVWLAREVTKRRDDEVTR